MKDEYGLKCCDVAIIDCKMEGGLDGPEIINLLKQKKEDIYIIAISVFPFSELTQADIFYNKFKPFEDLIKIIDSQIQKNLVNKI